jgi:hypothetical protein
MLRMHFLSRNANRMSFGDMVDVLRKGEVLLDGFNERGLKTLEELYEEISMRDKILILHNGRATTITGSIRIRIVWHNAALREVARRYFSARAAKVPGGVLVKSLKAYAFSESRRRGESVEKTVIRALWEEGQKVVLPDEVPRIYGAEKTAYGESSVYPGIFSIRHYQTVTICCPGQQWWPQGHTYRDKSVAGYTEWFSASNGT